MKPIHMWLKQLNALEFIEQFFTRIDGDCQKAKAGTQLVHYWKHVKVDIKPCEDRGPINKYNSLFCSKLDQFISPKVCEHCRR